MIQPQRQSNIQWPELIFHAECAREEFEDIQIVTAKSVYIDYAMADAANLHTLFVREYVRVGKDGIQVCVNAETVDDDAIMNSLDMVANALDQLEGAPGTIYFGEKLSFTTLNISKEYKH